MEFSILLTLWSKCNSQSNLIVNVPELSVPETLVVCENDSVGSTFLPSHQPRYIYEWTNETGANY
jgi:hypothetical protein